ncbi:MAG: cell division protein FtsQ [Pseudomonadota bacterium]
MHPSPPPRRWLAWGIVAFFVALELALILGNLLALAQEGFHKTAQNGWHDFIHGAPMRTLADDLRTTPLAEWLGRRQRELGWLVLGDLGPRVRQGCPGWLFLTDELRLDPQGTAHAQARADLARRVHAALAAQGHHLVLALVPDKTRIEADHLCSLRRPAALERRFQAWIETLRGQGVAVIPLDQPLAQVKARLGQAFDRTDTHWSQTGAEAAAQAIAAQLTAQGFVPSPRRDYRLERGPLHARWGDLVRLAGLDGLPEGLRPAPDEVHALRFELEPPPPSQVETLSADTLFGEPSGTRLTLVGTSFSRNASFADFLALHLHTDVGNLARDGGGFAQSMQQFLEHEMHEAGSSWVIWEIPERVLTEPWGEAERRLSATIDDLRVASEQQRH